MGGTYDLSIEYDVALSFAGEDREWAELLARSLAAEGYQVFYDGYEKGKMWGKNLLEYLQQIYSRRARFCVMLISESYAKKLWTTHERRAALERALREKYEYILPLRLDDTPLSGLPESTAYLDLREVPMEEILLYLRKKLGPPSWKFPSQQEPLLESALEDASERVSATERSSHSASGTSADHQHVGGVRFFRQRHALISEAILHFRRRVDVRGGRIPDPIRDFELVRWCAGIPTYDGGEFDNSFKLLLDGSRPIKEVATIILQRARDLDNLDNDSLIVLLSLLWLLRMYDLVVETAAQFQNHYGFLPASVRVIDAAAQLHLLSDPSQAEIQTLLEHTEYVLRAYPRRELRTYILGLAYLFASAEFRHKAARVWMSPQPYVQPNEPRWGERAYLLSLEGVRLFRRYTLEWAVAVNYSVYMGTMVKAPPEDLNPLTDTLITMQSNHQLWNYRFADTIAFRYYNLANERLSDFALSNQGLHTREEICTLLKMAQDWVSMAKPHFGDEEILRRELEIDLLSHKAGCSVLAS